MHIFIHRHDFRCTLVLKCNTFSVRCYLGAVYKPLKVKLIYFLKQKIKATFHLAHSNFRLNMHKKAK